MDKKNSFSAKTLAITVAFLISMFAFVVCSVGPAQASSKKQTVVFGYGGWDTIQVMVHVAAFITEHGYGYPVTTEMASNVAVLSAIQRGDIDVHMEVAERSLKEPLKKLLDSGRGETVGVSYPGTWQGWLVPTYMIKGDPKRGIKAMTPDLKSVFDLPKFWKLFKDPEDPTKGRFYSCIPGWQCEKTNEHKMKAYGLDKYYNVVTPGSNAALSASLVGAFEKGKPWFGYYWSPTWVLAKVDMTPLQEPAFDAKLWTKEANYACEFPLDKNLIVTNVSLRDKAPEIVDLLGKFNMTAAQLNDALLYMMYNKVDTKKAAIRFMNTDKAAWSQWVPADIAAKVEKALSK